MESEQSPFPGQRNPRSLDSARASSLVTPQLATTFRSRLPPPDRPSFFPRNFLLSEQQDYGLDPNTREFPREHEGLPEVGRSAEDSPATGPREHGCPRHLASQYPICLFLQFPEVPPVDVIKELADYALHRFVQRVPFLSALHVLFSAHKLPKHFTFALAGLGAILSDTPVSPGVGENLWQAAVYVHSACAEVDNRHARRVDWIVSYSLIQAFGIMHADEPKRAWVNSWNGHVETAARRFGLNHQDHFLSECSGDKFVIQRVTEHSNAMSFYFMLDFLRSLHYQVPASFYADDLFIPLSTGVSFRQAYRGLVLGTNNLPTGLISHDLLLLLLGILSDIVALQNTLGPALTRFGHHPGLQHLTCVDMELFGHDVPRETPRVSSPCEALLGDANEEYDPAAQYVNHFLPSTALDEYRRMSHSLMGGLVRWSHLFALHEESSQHVENSDNSLMTLFHLGRLLLSAGPDLFTFSALAGYGGAGSFGAPAPMDSRATPRITGATLKISWAILESIESQRDKSETPSLTPLWNPVATFYAALVAWASMHGQQSLTKRTELSQARRLLRLLRLELDDMVWPCSAVMSSILRDLEVRTETLGQA